MKTDYTKEELNEIGNRVFRFIADSPTVKDDEWLIMARHGKYERWINYLKTSDWPDRANILVMIDNSPMKNNPEMTFGEAFDLAPFKHISESPR